MKRLFFVCAVAGTGIYGFSFVGSCSTCYFIDTMAWSTVFSTT
jgi:hypothetical protein